MTDNNQTKKIVSFNWAIYLLFSEDFNPIAELIDYDEVRIITDIAKTKKDSKNKIYFQILEAENQNKEFIEKITEVTNAFPKVRYVLSNSGEIDQLESDQISGKILNYRVIKENDRKENGLWILYHSTDTLETPIKEDNNFLISMSQQLKKLKESKDSIKTGVHSEELLESIFEIKEKIIELNRQFIYKQLDLEEINDNETFQKKLNLIEQKTPVKIENALMIKSDIFKKATSLEEADFDEDGITKKLIKYRAANREVSTALTVKQPTEEKIDKILLFPLETGVKTVISRVPLTAYDGKVFKAICTVIDFYLSRKTDWPQRLVNGNMNIAISINQIHQAMGYPNKRISEAEIKRIANSILKLSTTQIHFDWREEMEARQISLNHAIDIYGDAVMYKNETQYMLESELIDIVPMYSRSDENGMKYSVQGIMVKDYPPMYAHAKLTGKIASVPMDWFEIKSFKRITDQRNSILQGLTERISTAYYFRNQGNDPNKDNYNVLVLDSFFISCKIEVNSRKTKNKYIKDIEVILDEYKTRGIIKDYEWKRKGNAIHSVKFYI